MRGLLLVALMAFVSLSAGCGSIRLPPAPDWEGLAPSIRAVAPGSGGPLIVVHGPEGPSVSGVAGALRRSGVFVSVGEAWAWSREPMVQVAPPPGGWLLEVERFDDGGRGWFRCGTGMFVTLGLIPDVKSGPWTFHYRLTPGRGVDAEVARFGVPGSRAQFYGWLGVPLRVLPDWVGAERSADVEEVMAAHILRHMAEAGVGVPVP
jgi:hypothetical protein